MSKFAKYLHDLKIGSIINPHGLPSVQPDLNMVATPTNAFLGTYSSSTVNSPAHSPLTKIAS